VWQRPRPAKWVCIEAGEGFEDDPF
jgi:hypothetical protein